MSLYRFEVSYTTGTGDADSSFSMTYYEMIYDATYTCVPDPLNDSGTLTASTEYTTIFDSGATTDPCGYYVLLQYEGDNTDGLFTYYSDKALAGWVASGVLALGAMGAGMML